MRRMVPFPPHLPFPREALYLPLWPSTASVAESLLLALFTYRPTLQPAPRLQTSGLTNNSMAFGKPKKEKVLKTVTAATADKSERQKSIDQALKEIRTKFGDESITTFGAGIPQKIPVIQTGSIGLDAALGVGGVPRGRIIEIFGPESSGKTTLALHVVAEAQKAGGIAAFVDAEHALDPEYARRIGVKLQE